MSYEIPSPSCHQAKLVDDQLVITIPSRKNWLYIPFLAFWLMFWAAGWISAFSSLFMTPGVVSGFLLIWLTFWTIGGVYAIITLLWLLAGKEIIQLSTYALVLRREVVGIGTTRRYLSLDVRDLRVSPTAGHGWYGRRQTFNTVWHLDGPIAFDYGAKTLRCGGGVDEAEAKQIVKLICQHFPQYG